MTRAQKTDGRRLNRESTVDNSTYTKKNSPSLFIVFRLNFTILVGTIGNPLRQEALDHYYQPDLIMTEILSLETLIRYRCYFQLPKLCSFFSQLPTASPSLPLNPAFGHYTIAHSSSSSSPSYFLFRLTPPLAFPPPPPPLPPPLPKPPGLFLFLFLTLT